MSRRTLGRGSGRSKTEVDALLARHVYGEGDPVAPSPRAVAVQMRDGEPLIVKRPGRPAVAVMPGVVELPVHDAEGAVLFRLEVEVIVDHDAGRVRRGRQTIIPLPDGPEPTGALIQRHALLGTAWREAVQHLTLDDHPKAIAASATRARPDAEAERRAVANEARRRAEAGEVAETRHLVDAIYRECGRTVTPDIARRRKVEARRAGLLPPAESTRPSV